MSPEGLQAPAVTQMMLKGCSSLKKGGEETHFLGWQTAVLQLHFGLNKGKWAKTVLSRN